MKVSQSTIVGVDSPLSNRCMKMAIDHIPVANTPFEVRETELALIVTTHIIIFRKFSDVRYNRVNRVHPLEYSN